MKKIFLYLAIATCFTACKKDKVEEVPALASTPAVESYSLAGFLKQTKYEEKVTAENGSNGTILEIGFTFEPQIDGNLTAYKIKLPTANSSYKIVLWDVATQLPILSQICNYTTPNIEASFALVTPKVLVKNKKYCISYIVSPTTSYFIRSRNNGTAATFPFSIGNMKIYSPSYKILTDQNLRAFPNNVELFIYYGDVSFTF